jgi:DNA-binding MarR family transcriptional regulator
VPTSTVAGGRQLADELLAALASLRRASRRHSSRPIELASLTGSQLELARLVRKQRGISITAAADELRLAPNTVSTLVSELTTTGVLVRRVDPSDRRVARLELVRSLERKIDAWRDRRATALGAAIRRLPEADRRRLEAALPALEQVVEELEIGGVE